MLIKYNINGIKCDNPDCDFKDMTVKFDDYLKWLNKPCPKCGSNLLTKEDLETVICLNKTLNAANCILKLIECFFKSKNETKIIVDMDGTGKLKFREKEDAENIAKE